MSLSWRAVVLTPFTELATVVMLAWYPAERGI